MSNEKPIIPNPEDVKVIENGQPVSEEDAKQRTIREDFVVGAQTRHLTLPGGLQRSRK